MLKRWLRFYAVGCMGFLVQLSTLYFTRDILGANYLLATALAVEVALVHNFFWHERWTWKTVDEPGWQQRALRYQFGTGTVAMLSNLYAMHLLVGSLGLPTLVASPIAIVSSGIINFLLGEFFVFSRRT